MSKKQSYFKEHYLNVVVPELIKKQGYKNKHQVPCIEKIVINSGINANSEKGWIDEVRKDLSLIAGQKPVVTKARMSISNFKLRKGMSAGVKVTLRGSVMYDFLCRLICVALPIIRDFRGVPERFDGSGNYNIGIQDHTIFPEISVDGKKNIGMDITIVTSAKTDFEAYELLALMGMPFRKTQKLQTKEAA